MSATTDLPCVYVFETTHHALWAEDVARARRIPAEVVPAPAEAKAGCDLALRSAGEGCGRLEAALGSEQVPFRRWLGADPADA